ncbi:MAG: hypothetical protein P9L97_09620 [Candidatus Tenebribacter davisii]|nr:hypothetical protein [Candidatus Tenebribacter davisii]
MKKTFLLSFLVLFSLLNASYLIDVYHKDYGVIDRTVLVFDTKPDYEILKHESDIQVNLHKCRKDPSLQKIDITTSKSITGFDYLISEDKVMVMIHINTSQLLVTGEVFKVEGMELQGEFFKLVLDIFISTNPQSISELSSYASFYETTGNRILADEYNARVVELNKKNKLPQENKVLQPEQANTSSGPTRVVNKMNSQFQMFKSKVNLKIVGIILCALILLGFVIFLIIKLLRRKSSRLDFDEDSLRPHDGFADREYLEKVVKVLSAKNWEVDEIAKELELPFSEVQTIIAPDLEQELEHL